MAERKLPAPGICRQPNVRHPTAIDQFLKMVRSKRARLKLVRGMFGLKKRHGAPGIALRAPAHLPRARRVLNVSTCLNKFGFAMVHSAHSHPLPSDPISGADGVTGESETAWRSA
jgi:hypothetical protein